MKPVLMLTLILSLPTFAFAEEAAKSEAPPKAEEAAKPVESDQVDISNLEEDYWRPNKDELEVVQNRRFDKKGRFELGIHHGLYQGKDYVNSKSTGASATYNFTNQFFTEISYHKVSNENNEFLNSVRNRFGFTPEFNREESQTVLNFGWTPIYAKFSLLGKKISHFETYLALGVGNTKTVENHISGHFTVGQKFFITENLIFRLEWRMSKYTDKITTTQGSTSLANGGPGFVEQSETTHNIIFGLGWMF